MLISMSDSLATLRLQDGVAILSLNRPERHNALVPELLNRLLSLLASKACREASVLMLRAEGRSFSTGGDLLGFQQHRDTIGEYSHELVGLLNEFILGLYRHPAPVICSVQGMVTGGSLGLLLAADRVVMTRGTTITPWYAEVGFSPDGGWAAMLPRITGRQRAADWVFTNASFDAQTCLELGLVHELVDHQCDIAALAWAKKVATMKSGSIRQVCRLFRTNVEELAEGLEAERLAFVEQVQTTQALEGIDSFLRRQENG